MRTRYLFIAVALFAACRGEQRAPQAPKTQTTATTASTATTPVPKAVAAPPPAPTKISSSTKCAGDGSYAKAVDCFRIAGRFHFVHEEPLIRAEGDVTRPRPGMERVQFRASGNEWIGEASASGVSWTRDGKHDANPPAFVERIWQRVTLYVDPQKKEGKALLAGSDLLGKEPYNIYQFTSGATGASSVVWVSENDGRLMRIKTTPLPQLADSSPEYTLDIQ
ncbi:MAG: hypothetical protein QOI24_4568 [Acidobacteriota bacterium]|jgi:hypothetical protein|nr:hypothetical protein [Acidobacteriota bacterium]